jgi:twitching motility two-component system response regulator PilH
MERKARKILVVEDEEDLVQYLTLVLKDHGFEVVAAEDGADGFAKAKTEHPDLITLDINLPRETGVRMYRNLHDDPETTSIPVVIITGIPHEFKRFIETRRRVPPPAGYFDKPVKPEELVAKIEQILECRA